MRMALPELTLHVQADAEVRCCVRKSFEATMRWHHSQSTARLLPPGARPGMLKHQRMVTVHQPG